LFSWDDAFMHGGPFAVLADRCAPIRATRQRIRPLKKEQKVYTFGSQRRSPPPQSGDSPTGHYVEARPLCSPSFKAAADAPWTVRGARRSVRADPLRRLSRVGSVVADFIASIIGSPAPVSAPQFRRFSTGHYVEAAFTEEHFGRQGGTRTPLKVPTFDD
jgi:hypothetical protein